MGKTLGPEKRAYPRIKTQIKVGLPKNISGESDDLSEGGLRFSSTETISSPIIDLKIHFPEEVPDFKINAKLIWRRNLEDGSSMYGVEFIELNETQKAALRNELIKVQIKGLLLEIKNTKVREDVSSFFLKDMLEYVSEINKVIAHLPKDDVYSEATEERLTHLNNQIVLKGYCLEELLSDKIIMQKVRDNFRHLIGAWAYKSPILKRAFEKPRGYPGDYLMLEAVYDNRPSAKGIGFYFDKYFLDNPYAVAVRCRKDKLREILKKEIKNSSLKIIKIFDIACGSCREVKELPQSLFKDKTVVFTCLDWDGEALVFSRQAVKDFPTNAKFNFIKEDIMNLINSFDKQDLVYSIGLIDYLPDRVLRLFMQFFYGLLKEKGKLVLTHKNKEKTFSPLPPAWFCDWKFIPRSKEEVINLFYNCGIKNLSLSTEADDFNDIFYFTIIKG